ncbi:MAG: radical SAM/SPASM domain-containing protein [Magnetococcales bacterium]|nr:radical SAM/SPASM domain-containing protein [Magnetococcales bacterium]MBF0151061.1 radical SAM/SPASM domain-containing protein [Magnetococcales bacterium]MBF0174740.1 radical SAM/SPASM domain-containing protein [Magnetococcales bacterium]MBF0347270.1 radical SAM/SPASM domain-containing protein [Magnetococcales bacterium]
MKKESDDLDRLTVNIADLEQVEIQIASWCNRSCSFCPSGKFPVPKTGMTSETVDRIISELERIGFSRTIGLHLMCEPLMHKNIQDIVKQFRDRLPNTFIRMESNGDALKNMDRLGSLMDHGLNEILINCYDSPEQFATFNQKILALDPTGGPIWYWNQWQRNPATPKKEWRVVKLRAFYGSGYSLKNWAGHVATQRPETLTLPLSLDCARPSNRLHVNYLGQVILCNMDWKFEVVVGDLRTQKIEDLCNAPILLDYRRHLKAKDRNMPLCRQCDSGGPTGLQPSFPAADPWTGLRALGLDLKRWHPWKRIRSALGIRPTPP